MDKVNYRSGWKALRESSLAPEEQEKLKKEYLSNAITYAKVFKGRLGKEVLNDLAANTYGRPSFNFMSENAALEAAFTAGMRETFEYILRKIEVAEKGDSK